MKTISNTAFLGITDIIKTTTGEYPNGWYSDPYGYFALLNNKKRVAGFKRKDNSVCKECDKVMRIANRWGTDYYRCNCGNTSPI